MDQMPADEPASRGEVLPRLLLDALATVVDDYLARWAEFDEEAQDRRAEWSATGDGAGVHAQWVLRAEIASMAERAERLALKTAEALAPSTRELVRSGAFHDTQSPLHTHLAQVARGLKASHGHALALREGDVPAATFRAQLQGLCHGILRVNGGLMQLELLLQELQPA